MHAQIHSIAFRGIETIAVTVQIHIALGLMVAMGVVPRDAVEDALVLAELALDVAIQPVSGVLPAAIVPVAASRDLICPHDCGSEAAWADGLSIIAPPSLCLLYTSPSPRDATLSRMPSSA